MSDSTKLQWSVEQGSDTFFFLTSEVDGVPAASMTTPPSQPFTWHHESQDDSEDLVPCWTSSDFSPLDDPLFLHSEDIGGVQYTPEPGPVETRPVSIIALGDIENAGIDSGALFATEHQDRDLVMNMIGHVLEAIDDALETGQLPVLRLWSRDSAQALVFNETLELNASQMRLKSVKYPSQRFDVYWCLLKEIHQGLIRNTVSKKREIFYRHVEIFKTQARLDEAVEDIACTLRIPRRCLNVVAGSKGLVAGNLMLIMKDGTSIDCSQSGNQGILIPHMEDVESVVTTASHVLIVEKESSFSELLSNDIIDASQEDLILVTGKGYPDISSRLLVKLLSQIVRAKEVRNAMGEMELQMVPPPRISCLTDGDPHGFQIFLNYKFGSKAMAHDASRLAIPCTQHLGLRPSDWNYLGLDLDKLIPFTMMEHRKCLSLLRNPVLRGCPDVRREISRLLHLRYKGEIQCFDSATLIHSLILR